MSGFDGLPRAVLMAISNLSGDDWRDVGGDDLMAELASMGHPTERPALWRLLKALQRDGFIECYFGGAMSFDLIRLDTRGRQEIGGWPVPGQLSAASFNALLAVLNERANDESLPEPERSKFRKAAAAFAEFTSDAGASFLAAWAARMTGVSP